jgi:hypothetical protein
MLACQKDIGIKPGFKAEEKHEYGSKLVRQLIKIAIKLGKKM